MSDMTAVPAWLDGWAWKSLMAVLSLLGVDTVRRVRKLEITSKTTADAAADRVEIKTEIARLSDKVDGHRREQREDAAHIHETLGGQINDLRNTIMNRLGGE